MNTNKNDKYTKRTIEGIAYRDYTDLIVPAEAVTLVADPVVFNNWNPSENKDMIQLHDAEIKNVDDSFIKKNHGAFNYTEHSKLIGSDIREELIIKANRNYHIARIAYFMKNNELKEKIKISLEEIHNDAWYMDIYQGHHSLKAAALQDRDVAIDFSIVESIFEDEEYDDIDKIINEMFTGRRRQEKEYD